MQHPYIRSRLGKVFFAAAIFVCAVSAAAAPIMVGAGIPKGAKATPIESIAKSPKKYDGKKVMVNGKLFEQCPKAEMGHGCWLTVLPGKAKSKPLYIEFEANGLYFPKKLKANSMVKVSGVIKMKGDEPTAKTGPVKKGEAYISAEGAEITEK